MIKIPDDFIQKIREQVNLAEIVREYTILKKSGTQLSGLCPFHQERSPSFYVSEEKQLYNCHGCQKGGDLISFVREIEGLSFVEAVLSLAERAGLAAPKGVTLAEEGENSEETRKMREAKEKASLAFRLTHFTALFYQKQLRKEPRFLDYLHKRGVNEVLIESFLIGAAPSGWENLSKHLLDTKAPLNLAAELGLVQASQKMAHPSSTGYFDAFRERVMFPIFSLQKKIAGFGGRHLPESHALGSREQGPPYLNSSESFIFSKGKLLFGLFQAQKHIRAQDEVVIVEGYFDVLGMHAAGFENTVASCGVALSTEHLSLLSRLSKKIILLFDGDTAGRNAMDRSMVLGLEQGVILYGAFLPQDKDPDEIVIDPKTGKPSIPGIEQMKNLLVEAQPLLDLRVAEMLKSAESGSEAKTQAIKVIGGWLSRFRDPVGREVRLQDVTRKLQVPRTLLEQGSVHAHAHQAPTRVQASHAQSAKPANTGATAKLRQAERVVLSALARQDLFERELDEAMEKLPPEMTLGDLFDHPAAREAALYWRREGEDQASFLARQQDTQVRSVLTEAVLSEDQKFTNQEVRGALFMRLKQAWARFSHAIEKRLKQAEAIKNRDLEEKLKKEYLDVQRRMKEFISLYDEN